MTLRTRTIGRLALFALALLLSPVLHAAETGSLKVNVKDADGLGVPGATVTISAPTMMGTKSAPSDASGAAVFSRLTPGLYQVETALQGFGTVTMKDVRVVVDKTQSIDVTLTPKAEASVSVTADYPIVDTTKSAVTAHIQVDRVEALPVGRDYVAYMQLVSGVNVVANAQGVDTPEDPAGKGGLNYSDRSTQRAGAGKTGSRDNIYYIDGVNITDMSTQTGILTFNNETILEQEIISSGVPAEYAGGKGVVANIVTKAGGNDVSGSANIYAQPKDFVQDFNTDDDRLHVPVDTKYDAAATLGGPLSKDRAWLFGSAQKVDFSNEIQLSTQASASGEKLDYNQDRTNFFGKLSVSPSANDSLVFSGFLANRDIEGSRDPNVLPDRRSVSETNYHTLQGYYQRSLGSSLVWDARFGRYGWDDTQSPINPDAGPQNNVLYTAPRPPIYERQFGGFSTARDDDASRTSIQSKAEWNVSDHRVKFGVNFAREKDKDEAFYPDGFVLNSIDPGRTGLTLQDAVTFGFVNRSEVEQQLVPALNRNQDATTRAIDANGDGTVSIAEAYAVRFTAMNAHGLNFLRTSDVQTGANEVKADRWSLFLQDDFQVSPRLTLNAGLRLEDNKYIDSEGGTIAHLDPALLPRVGASWDVNGDGRNKVSLFYGQYLDPLPFDMVHFAGNISGRVRNEEIFLNGAFYPYRVRGSAEFRDAVYVPNIKDQRSHEVNATVERNFGEGLVGSVQAYWRKDVNIIEDYDLHLYLETLASDPNFSHLALTPEDFGYPGELTTSANFFLSNLIGAKRRYLGLDFDLRKQFRSGSLIVAQYSWKDSEGNSQSDGNADLQGDFVVLDPRNPWMLGRIPGTIDHQIKLYGTYRTKFGLDVGGLFYWNSGTAYTESDIFIPGVYNIYTNRQLDEDGLQFAQTGLLENPSYYQIDLKLSYARQFGGLKASFFLDLYNLTNNQDVIEVMAGVNDQLFQFQEGTRQLQPRRAYLGARLNF